jgi:phage-related protein
MARFQVIFHPTGGERGSPRDILAALADTSAKVGIVQRLKDYQELDYTEWPREWSKKHTGDICQFDKGDYRVMYALDAPFMVVVHICRKRGQKTHPKDKAQALRNYEDYLARKGEL